MCLSLKFLDNSVCLIIQDRFWVVHVPLVLMVKFKSLAEFLEDHLPHIVVPSLIVFLRKFAALTYYMIDCLVSFTT